MVRPIMNNRVGRMALALLALSAVLAPTFTPAEAGEKRKSEVKVTATAGKAGADGKQRIVVVLEINPGWIVYANPIGDEEFKGLEAVVKVSASQKLESVQVTYPPGQAVKDDILKITYNVYEGKVEIPVTVQRANGDSGRLEVTVRYRPQGKNGV